MSNKEPWSSAIPPLHEEKPIKIFRGFPFSNEAWHARHDDLWPPKAGEALPPEDFRQAIDLYLGNFCRPVRSIANEVRCVACNETLTSPYGKEQAMGMMHTPLKVDKNSPTWEARCGNCAYPIRCKHSIHPLPPRPRVPMLVHLDFFPMCYHPRATDKIGLIQ